MIIKRIFEEFLIFAFDFDCTLFVTDFPTILNPIEEIIEFAKRMKEAGNKIILNTCCRDNYLEQAVAICHQSGLDFDAVNANIPEVIEKYGGDTRKINADIYVDDKNVLFEQLKDLGV